MVPRGIYFQSKFHKLLNDTWNNVAGSALVGAKVIGNGDANSRSLNARVVQMIVSHNVTAAQAEDLLGKLLVNESGGELATFLAVASEFYTMGFVQRVIDLTPNVAVLNTGNYSPPSPPPPPTDTGFWGGFWNTLAGAVQFVWNAVQAVAVYISNIVAAVLAWGLSVAQAFAQAAYEAVKAVAKAVVDAILAVLNLVFDLLKKLIDWALSPLRKAWESWSGDSLAGFMRIIQVARHGGLDDTARSGTSGGSPGQALRRGGVGFVPMDTGSGGSTSIAQLAQVVGDWINGLLFVFSVLMLIAVVLMGVELVIKAFSIGTSILLTDFVAKYLIKTILILILSSLVAAIIAVVVGSPLDLIPSQFFDKSDWVFSIGDFLGVVYVAMASHPSFTARGLYIDAFAGTIRSLAWSGVSMLVLAITEQVPRLFDTLGFPREGRTQYAAVFGLDLLAVVFAYFGNKALKADKGLARWAGFVHAVGEGMGLISMAVAVTAATVDGIKLGAAWGKP